MFNKIAWKSYDCAAIKLITFKFINSNFETLFIEEVMNE